MDSTTTAHRRKTAISLVIVFVVIALVIAGIVWYRRANRPLTPEERHNAALEELAREAAGITLTDEEKAALVSETGRGSVRLDADAAAAREAAIMNQ